MRRRDFIKVIACSTTGWPLGARAQQPERMRRIGALMATANDQEGHVRVTVFENALQALGWTVDRNIEIVYRWAAGAADMQPFALELVRASPDVLLATNTTSSLALAQATRTVPIVFVQVSDPLGTGLVTSLARPDRNLTGFTNFEFSVGGKWLEILKEIKPQIVQFTVLYNAKTAPYAESYVSSILAASRASDSRVNTASVHNETEIDSAIAAMAEVPNSALIAMPDVFIGSNYELIVALASRYRLPAIYPFRYFATAGGLCSYGTDQLDLFKQAASYIDRILKGTKLADLPVQQPTKYELVINLKTAKALGLNMPSSLLARADEVIE
jgi:putative tryptophan/tyrosine transport system substrate-binding protein